MSFIGTAPRPPVYGRAGLPLGALDGVRTRRLVALTIDLGIVAVLAAMLWLPLLVLTFGLSLFIWPTLFPFVAFFYNGLSVSGARMATPGMRCAGLQMRMDATGARVPFINAALHAVLFYLTWGLPLLFLVCLVTEDKRCLHDVFAGVIFVRRMG